MNALERFLDTPHLNQRTHDDKTLILASRLPITATMATAIADPQPTAQEQGDAPAAADAGPDPAAPIFLEDRGDEAV